MYRPTIIFHQYKLHSNYSVWEHTGAHNMKYTQIYRQEDISAYVFTVHNQTLALQHVYNVVLVIAIE